MIDVCHCVFAQIHKINNTRSEFECKHWVTVIKQCPTLVGDVDNGDIMHVWKQGAYGKSLYPPLNFTVNLKLP